jgi:hypothetical protein
LGADAQNIGGRQPGDGVTDVLDSGFRNPQRDGCRSRIRFARRHGHTGYVISQVSQMLIQDSQELGRLPKPALLSSSERAFRMPTNANRELPHRITALRETLP